MRLQVICGLSDVKYNDNETPHNYMKLVFFQSRKTVTEVYPNLSQKTEQNLHISLSKNLLSHIERRENTKLHLKNQFML